ncbi:N-formylglutamate amidohydrolase [Gluconobacter albidus]|uniref:N-formylglutamate amidohydrolase n=1 Tax=Gluconobacter albidus TaxID=318683 RepID=UPI0009EF33A8|nr:N-formylglutamate amidohydrolase [Gluconobacter albidus]MCP1274622.1 N-formylglutamate amidohydrolase [Gluconobacter albidus]
MKISSPLTSFKVDYPRNTAIPVIVSSPHSGRFYPSDFLSSASLSLFELQRIEDRFMDQLLEDAPDFGATLLSANFSRAWCDVNRDWREVDGEMFNPVPPEDEVISSAKVQAGFGVIPRCISQGRPIYRHPLELSELRKRISTVWLPYHEALDALLEETSQRFGYAILLDLHSMPKLPYARSCDVVLGDLHGKSCDQNIIDKIENIIKNKYHSVRRNIPYSGGYITQHYGRPERKIHTVQIEICRSLYLNSATLQPGGGFMETKQNMRHFLAAISDWLL